MENELPYRAEYAKSGRAKCKGCKGDIAKDTLRMAVMVQSPAFDGKTPNWYHFMCFFGRQKPQHIEDIAHFESLRWEDQEKIKGKIEAGGSVSTSGKKKGGKGKAGVNNDFSVEYAKSGKSKCRRCEENIEKGAVRISKKDYDSEKARMFGALERWHHVDCFIKSRTELEYFESAKVLAGFNSLSPEDKKELEKKIKPVERKRKLDDVPDSGIKRVKSENDEVIKKQNKLMFKVRDLVSKHLTKKELVSLMEYNEQYVPTGESRILDLLSDVMVFGALQPCEVCDDGNFTFSSGTGYICKGVLTEFTNCTNVLKEPKRIPFKIPPELLEEYSLLNPYHERKTGTRIFTVHERKENNGAVKMEVKEKPLTGMDFVITGSGFQQTKKAIKDTVVRYGGSVSQNVNKRTAAVITTSDEIGKKSKHIQKAQVMDVHCVPEDFLDEVKDGGALLMIQKKSIAPWGCDPQERIYGHLTKESGSLFTKSMPDKHKVKLKGGAAVDPDSGIDDCAHVYKRGSKLYSTVLNMVDVMRGLNSYYKLQLLEQDNKRRWYVFRSWGRIGTTIGGNKLEDMEDLNDAIQHFENLYMEKTGNLFSAANFSKLPGRFFPMELDYGEDQSADLTPVSVSSESKLPVPVQELVSLLFDINKMKDTMVEFEIDLKKMPLGKLSKKQIADAYKVLSEALQLLEGLCKESKPDVKGSIAVEPGMGTNNRLLDCSNKFYTLIPHDFGMKKPPLLNDIEFIKLKIGMLDNLSEIEIAYNLLKAEDDSSVKSSTTVDKYYHKLKTELTVIDKSSEEFVMLKKYVENTHACTHHHYTLQIDEIFKVVRKGEKARYKPFKQLHNRQLLWHGSRLTNFASILSQGLRIAPPEAPVTGYMFGKGIYFADMVSKSANYCCATQSDPTGLLLLCEVALGDMYEQTAANYIEKLPKGKHSTKGLGKTYPDPSAAVTLEGGVTVPLGPGVNSEVKRSSLLYNEYIVYDVAQVNVKYLLKTTFKFKF